MSRFALSVAALAVALGVGACASSGVTTKDGIARPWGHDFFEFPAKYRNRTVRIESLEVGRAELTRPLVLLADDAARSELVLSDGRSVARRERLQPGERVSVVFRCTEGRSDRGNLVIAVERVVAEPTAAATTAR